MWVFVFAGFELDWDWFVWWLTPVVTYCFLMPPLIEEVGPVGGILFWVILLFTMFLKEFDGTYYGSIAELYFFIYFVGIGLYIFTLEFGVDVWLSLLFEFWFWLWVALIILFDLI